MARLSTNRVAWTYTADDGTAYRVAAEKGIVDQAKQGGADGSGVNLPKPAWLKMRRVTVTSAAHGSRVVPLYDIGAPLATAGTTIVLNADTDSFAFTSNGNPLPEGHIIHNVTHDAT
jgi:hypothetical protein